MLGGSARPDQIEALGPEGASRALRALVAAGLLAHTPDGTYEVADPLLREVAYEALPHRARADLHKTAASIAVDDEERARHLELAATHDPRNVSVRAEAAAATAAAASGLIDTGRVVDGIRLFQRAIDLGFREPEGLIALARRLTENSRDAEALAVVELLPDDAEDPTVAIEKIHVRAVALLQDQPAEAVALLDEAAERWRALGRQEKVGWAYANQAVAYFVLGQLEDTGRALDLADGHFSAAGSRQGQLAVTGMQQLARPDDPRILGWLHEALEYAVSSGDRSRQRGVVSGLAWHHYLQARFGGELDQLMADTYLIRFGALGRELGSDVDQLTTLVLRSNMARMSGQLALAADLIGRSCGLSAGTDFEEIFERAGTFAAALAADSAASLAAPPLAAEITDPRAGLAQMMVIEALLLAGRVDDAVAVLTEVHTVGQMGAVGVVSQGLAEGLRWLLTGRFDRAEAAARAMAEAAERVGARPALVAARAMLAEALWCTGRSDDALALLDQLAGDPVGGLAGALVLRARAVAGDPAAFAALPAELARLAAPGLALNPEVSA